MEIQDLLGRPIHSPEIKEFFAQYHLPQNPNPEYDAYGNLFWVPVNNEEKTIRCLFTGYVRYAPAYGEPIGNYNKEKDQLNFCIKSPLIHDELHPMEKFLI